jgi:hypothetical protein
MTFYFSNVTNVALMVNLFSEFHKEIILNTKKNKMRANIGKTDKSIRVIIGLIFIGLFFTNIITGVLAIVLLVLSGIFILTSLFSFCPLYYPFGISTRQKEK